MSTAHSLGNPTIGPGRDARGRDFKTGAHLLGGPDHFENRKWAPFP